MPLDRAQLGSWTPRRRPRGRYRRRHSARPSRAEPSLPAPGRSTDVIFDVAIAVTLKPVVNDPQGLVVHSGLEQLGFTEVSDVRVGKYIQMRVEAADEDAARLRVTQMCEQLLRNPVIEDYRIGLEMQLETAR